MVRLSFLPPIMLLALAACGSRRTPPPLPTTADVATPSAAVHQAVLQNEAVLAEGSPDSRLATLEATVMGIADSYGQNSPETIQALTETSTLLSNRERFDLALPFMERALTISREVYGPDHRETAYAMQDVASLLTEIDPGVHIPRAEQLFRDALAARLKQLGPDHPETAASEAQLAWQLLLGAGAQTLPEQQQAMLAEAERLALHAQKILDAADDDSYWLQVRRIGVEAAFARGDYAEVQRRVRALPDGVDYPRGPGLYPDATARELLSKAPAEPGLVRPVEPASRTTGVSK